MDALFRVSGAVRRQPRIDAWLEAQPPDLGALARMWFARMRDLGPDVRELMHDGLATACVQDAAFAYVGVFRAHVNVGFFHGVELPDPGSLLEGTGKRMRHVKLRPDESAKDAALRDLIDVAYKDVRVRLEFEREGR